LRAKDLVQKLPKSRRYHLCPQGGVGGHIERLLRIPPNTFRGFRQGSSVADMAVVGMKFFDSQAIQLFSARTEPKVRERVP